WMKEEWGYRLTDSFGPYTLNEILKLLDKLVHHLETGIKSMKESLDLSEPKQSAVMHNALGIWHSFRSCRNIFRAWKHRGSQKALEPIYQDEIEHLRELLVYFDKIPHYGFHAECQEQFFVSSDVSGKIKGLSDFLQPD
ncbi:MAG: hypothetical protein JNM63_18285, partial [Spirochaetia bacterium]|nr:hypothetical protein [Spirochaetia bacterium]